MGRPTSLKQSVPSLIHIVRHLWPWIRKHRPLIGRSLALLLVGIVLQLLEPWPLKFVLDSITASPKTAPADRVIGADMNSAVLLAVCAVSIVALSGLRALAEYWQTIGFAQVGNRVLRDVRDHTYRHLQSLSLDFHHQSRGGDLTVRLTRDVSMLRDVSSTAIMPLLANCLVLIGMVGIMFWLQWRLALAALATLPLFWVTTIRTSRSIHRAAKKQRRREGEMAATAAETMAAIKDVQALALEEQFAEGFSGQNKRSQKQDLQTTRLSARLERSVDVLLAIATALVVWYGARLVMSHQLTVGELIIFLTYLKRSFRPARDFAKFSGRLAKAAAAGERVLDILEQTPRVLDSPTAVEAPAFQGHVRFDDVTFGYEPTTRVFDGFCLDVEPGRCVAIVGESGSGKSTLASLLLRLYDPNSGRVLIDGRDLRNLKVASLRRQIGVVLQDSVIFAASLSENIRCGVKATDDEVRAAAHLANADGFISALPDDYATIPAERGLTLSRGQRQRIAIARVALRKTPILVLDEPTTGLDRENKKAVGDAIRNLATDRTTFIITHDSQLAAAADDVIDLDKVRLNTLTEQSSREKTACLTPIGAVTTTSSH